MFFRPTICTFGIALACTVSLRADPGDTEFFEKKIRPLLDQRCSECHSAEKKVKGGLRLDSREGWQTGGDSGAAIVPGKPDDSLLIKAVRYRDKDLAMPPKKKLSADEVATLEQWVKMGAPDPRSATAVAGAKKQVGLSIEAGKKFWSYIPPKKSAPPAVKDTAWPRGEIDHFILAKIEEKSLRPAPDASPEVLVRRLYYTLTGLPPSPEEVDAFVREAAGDKETRRGGEREKDAKSEASLSPPLLVSLSSLQARKAIEALVDRLLASPHFGETWGRHWLDVARFAESSGGGRTLLFKDAWRYRDYVIDAFNHDEPFDRFIREQIAGDLLPAATSEDKRRQLTATAFLALGPTNYEEQNKQQLRFDVIDEQLDTIGKGVLGQTIGCARCHDHKFDPIPQKDYYALAGILSSTRTLFNYTDNVARWISEPLKLEGEEEKKFAAQEAKLAALKQELDAAKKDLTKMKAVATKVSAGPGTSIAAADLPGIIVDDVDAKAIGEWSNSKHVATFIGAGYRTDDNLGKGTKTITFTPKLPKSGRYEVRFAYPASANRAKKVPVHILHAEGEEKVFVDETLEPPIGGRFLSLGKFRFEQDGAGFVLVSNADTKGFVVADAIQFIAEEDVAALDAAVPPAPGDDAGKRNDEDRRKKMDARVKEMESSMKKLTTAGPHRPTAMAVHDEQDIGDTQIRVRGLVGQKGAPVPRGFLQVLGSAPAKISQKESGRRELADWLASPANPLTARVFVNRAWDWSFGSGLVRTTENFGTTGELPSHAELLDFLALRFVENGWSVKKLLREIVLSRTWQQAVANDEGRGQSANGTNQKSEIRNQKFSDPDNRLFAHANRRRLDAEQIRDTMLAVSGALDLRTLGPNIGNAGEINANDTSAQNVEYKYEFTDVRRSVYTPAFRNRRLELFEAFDFADINAPVGHRSASTVAPQALFLLNSPFVLAQAKTAAERALASSAGDDERLANAFRTTLCRMPNEKERAIFSRALNGVKDDRRTEAWSQVYQTLFCSLDFRFLE